MPDGAMPDGRRAERAARRTGRTRKAAPGPAVTRAERRRAVQVRRHRLVLVAAVAVSVAVVAAWFPATDLLHQHEQLTAASAQLDRVRKENSALSAESKRLRTPSEIARIATQQYGLVEPGQQVYQVLPPSGTGSGVTGATASEPAGKGHPPVPPASGASTSSQGARSGAVGGRGSAGGRGFLSRVLQTLEFWR